MITRPVAVALLLSAAACAPKQQWEDAAAADPLQVERDNYACMQENAFVSKFAKSDETGFRAGTHLEYDLEMHAACMRARGYTLVDVPRAERAPLRVRPPEQGPAAVHAEVGVGGGFSAETLDAVYFGAEVEYDSRTRTLGNAPVFWAVGGSVHPHPLIEIGARAGTVRSAAYRYTECESTGGTASECTWGARTWGQAPFGSLDVLARLPPFPRVAAVIGLGAQTLRGTEGFQGTLDVEMYGGVQRFDVSIPDRRTALLPYARYGVQVDLVYAEPHGLRLGCTAQSLLRDPLLEGDARVEVADISDWSQGTRTAGACSLAYRWSPAPR